MLDFVENCFKKNMEFVLIDTYKLLAFIQFSFSTLSCFAIGLQNIGGMLDITSKYIARDSYAEHPTLSFCPTPYTRASPSSTLLFMSNLDIIHLTIVVLICMRLG